MAIYHYRCRNSKCRGRRTFKWKVHLGTRKIPKCGCGRAEWTPDLHRDNVENKNPCNCCGYHFPHRKGSLWCDHATKELTQEDWESRYG